jgi:ADP-ribose pyrophosphatase YjhB (NUDIX family)
MNVAASHTYAVPYRQTVSGLFYCLGSNDDPLIGIHWPAKAALAQEPNLSPVAGEWKNNERAVDAMIRQLKAEYGLKQFRVQITPLSHSAFVSVPNRKQYHWMLVHLMSESGHVQPQASDVASFGWYGPAELQSAIDLMHAEKQRWFLEVLKLAIDLTPDLIPFGKQFGRRSGNRPKRK